MFELTFWGGTAIRHRRLHKTYEAAEDTALRILAQMDERGEARAAHPAIITGPGCGRDGRTIP
jgi:hypothetical protein